MGKYSDNQSDIFSVFDATAWKAESIPTFPADYSGDDIPDGERIRVSIIASGPGVNKTSVSGTLIIDIFTSAGAGPARQNFIADRLDAYLENRTIQTKSGGNTQLRSSALQPLGQDRDNPSLSRASYEIPFNFFGVTN